MAPNAPAWAWVLVFVPSIFVAVAAWLGLVLLVRPLGLSPAKRTNFLAVAALLLGGGLALDVVLGATHALRAGPDRFPFIGLPIAGMLAIGFLAFFTSPTLRRALDAIPQPWLLGVQAGRVIGGSFLVLMAIHQLPARFAVPAGTGDAAVGLAAPVVAYVYARRGSAARPLAFAFNLVGILDLVVAVTMGFTSAPGPQRLFFGGPSTAVMAVLPMVLIPVFLVPLAILDHAASLRGLLADRTEAAPGSEPLTGRTWRPTVNRLVH